MALDWSRTNLACEATDSVSRPLHSSAHSDPYPIPSPAHDRTVCCCGAVSVNSGGAGPRRRQTSRTKTLLPIAHIHTSPGLPECTSSGCPSPDGAAGPRVRHDGGKRQATRAFMAREGMAGSATLPNLRRQGMATWRMPAGITLKSLLPSTGGGLVDFALLQQWAGNERVEIG